MNAATFAPGNLVRARGREWIVLPGSDPETLKLRPLSGADDDATLIYLPLELDPVGPATFPPPDPERQASHEAALLLRDALLLSLRRGAGPFRSFGHIAVEPRAYQLVPLLMALRLDPVRLLIADDVGIGKTIEGALIARELIDRGEVDRLTVLCPPHLVEQWQAELDERFHIKTAAVTAATAARLERELPLNQSIFEVHPYTVVSLDYIKSDRRRDDFVRTCPDFVLVDEAHTCAGGAGRHQRYELLRGLASKIERHLVLLTATPHSGDEEAFYRLLGLLDPSFEALRDLAGDARKALYDRLGNHFVQRQRVDIERWENSRIFPKRETTEVEYRLSGYWQRFFEDVLDYCAAVTEAAGGDERRQRLTFWGTLALMRCVSSSPAAAARALRTRAGLPEPENEEELENQVFDGGSDTLPQSDAEPEALPDPALAKLLATAESLCGEAGDPKLAKLASHLDELVRDGFSPIVFCRYIATAKYLHDHLASRWKGRTVGLVTGELDPEDRRERVRLLEAAEQRLLIATDCLSEGINLQHGFDAVVHYDLSWNPMRHEQREGRVDRFHQPHEVVRTTLLYGANNPVDGAVLDVILRKAERIRRELGVAVPLPDEHHRFTEALMKAVLLRRRERRQLELSIEDAKESREIDTVWRNASERMKRNRTIFAQARLRPDEVLPEWQKVSAALGTARDVERFVTRALSRFGAAPDKAGIGWRAPLGALPEHLRERLFADGLEGKINIGFDGASEGFRTIHRSHPLVSILAETLLESSLEPNGTDDPAVLGRCGCWSSRGVSSHMTIALLRLRHEIAVQRRASTYTMLVEEACAFAWQGKNAPTLLDGKAVLELLAEAPAGDPPDTVRRRELAQALERVARGREALESFARGRAEQLLEDHRRVRNAAQARGSYSIRAILPADVIGLFVLLPVLA